MRQICKATLLWCLPFLLLSACSNESKVKKVSLEEAKQAYETQIRAEMKSRILPTSTFRDAYRETILGRAQYEILSLNIEGTAAETKVQVKGVPYKARKVLIDIINKTDERAKFAFNVPDALRLILQELGLPDEGDVDKTYKLRLKNNEGAWAVVDRIED